MGFTDTGTLKGVRAQVCNVNRDLLSVSKVVDGGSAVVFHPQGAFIHDLTTDERTWLERENGMYTLTLWVETSLFTSRARESLQRFTADDACKSH